ncbi:hypothetical protein SEMRO_244_G097060.1 [Seminavis robusta]|uniref:Uncharacterized protein n=1 Tax=Seminavis robusta TaxID=568900 RepID=A0A9N8HAZ9_9STRA|nr:hypothetical protein SEMRO_244_G097060.1 [Seminavis robusta]|eukprot:Sro244_g097060.1 n/a (415) ;mRNA; f:9404-10851
MPSVPTVTRTRRKSSRKTKKQEQPPIEEISTKPAGAPEEEDFSIITTTDISTGTMNDSVVPTQNIPVDMRHLWKTAAPFTIYTAENMKGGNEKFKGFIIEMKVDPHDVFGADDEEEGFPYQARVLTNDTIVIDAPLKGHQAMGGYDEAIGKMLNEKNEDDKVLLEAFQNGRVEFERAVAAHGKVNKMVYRLKFSGRDVELSAEALDIHPKNDTHVLQMEALPLSVPVVHLNSTPKKTTMVVEEETEMEEEVYVIDHFWAGNLIWRVADKSQSTRKAKGGKKGKSKTDAAAAMFGRSPTTAQHHTTSSSRTNKEKSDRTSHSALVPTSNTAVSGNGNRKKQSSLLAAVAKGDGKKNKVKDDEGEKMINRLVAEGTELSAAASMELDDVLGKRNRGVDEDDGNDRTDDKAVYEADY